ncbi:MAG: hypothetical protein FWD40_08475 [Treponema sp.]|nr:hypothetical protein [Treponema sp.]
MIRELSANPDSRFAGEVSGAAISINISNRLQLQRPDRLESLRHRIDDEDYLHAAIQRLALVLSKELMEITEGGLNERKRRK